MDMVINVGLQVELYYGRAQTHALSWFMNKFIFSFAWSWVNLKTYSKNRNSRSILPTHRRSADIYSKLVLMIVEFKLIKFKSNCLHPYFSKPTILIFHKHYISSNSQQKPIFLFFGEKMLVLSIHTGLLWHY